MDVLSVARAALAGDPVCDRCLGRLVADRSFGLSNAERGKALRVTVALADDEDYEPPESCWVCENEFDRLEWWVDQAVAAVHGYEFDTYQVGTTLPPLLEENDRLLREDVGLPPAAGEPMNREFNREIGKRFGERTGAEVDFDRPAVQFRCDLTTDEVDLQVNSAFVYGRYRKLARDIPQTEWPCTDCHGTGRVQGSPCDGCDGTGYRYDESVEQLTAPVVQEAMDGSDATFHGAGREDVDARMLGTGRPFVIEVHEPRIRDVDTAALTDEITAFAEGRVAVDDLALATYEMVERVKEHDASKHYRMAVEFGEEVSPAALQSAIESIDGAVIEQRTPQRVSHRRAAKTRRREVYAMAGRLAADDDEASEPLLDVATAIDAPIGATEDDVLSPDQFSTSADAIIEVHGEGGLYVKELVSGDEGRTEPSLAGTLGVDATVLALDVLAVTGESEPFALPAFCKSSDQDTE